MFLTVKTKYTARTWLKFFASYKPISFREKEKFLIGARGFCKIEAQRLGMPQFCAIFGKIKRKSKNREVVVGGGMVVNLTLLIKTNTCLQLYCSSSPGLKGLDCSE